MATNKILDKKYIQDLFQDALKDEIKSAVKDIIYEALHDDTGKASDSECPAEDPMPEEFINNAPIMPEKPVVQAYVMDNEISKESDDNPLNDIPSFTVYDPIKGSYINVNSINKSYMPDNIYVGYEVATYLKSVANSMKKLLNACKNKFKNETPEQSEEERKFHVFLMNLTWDDLLKMIEDNKMISLDDMPPIQKIGNPIDTYFVIIKNTLIKFFRDHVNFNDNPDDFSKEGAEHYYENKLSFIILEEYGKAIELSINNLILNKHKEIFDILFGKDWYINND